MDQKRRQADDSRVERKKKRNRKTGPRNSDLSKKGGNTSSTHQNEPQPSGGYYSQIRMENQNLEEYYKMLLSQEDFEAAFAFFRTPLPAAIRVNRTVPLWRATMDTIRNLSVHKVDDSVPPSTEDSSLKVQLEEKSRIECTAMQRILKCEMVGNSTIGKYDVNRKRSGIAASWYPDGLVWQWEDLSKVTIKKDKRFSELKEFLISEDKRGAIIRQEAASMIPPLFMDLHPDHLVLDMCAAPGSKTSQILDFLTRSKLLHKNGCGRESLGGVIANEVDVKRAAMLAHQLHRLGLPAVSITCCDAAVFPFFHQKADGMQQSSEHKLLQFDRILADVPCSGDGTLRKNPDIWKSWTITGAMSLHLKQIAILRRGLELLKVGGRLVYSTCSLNPIENEAVIASIVLQLNPHVEITPLDSIPGLQVSPGMKSWLVADQRKRTDTHNDNDSSPIEFFQHFESVPLDRRAAVRPSMFPPLHKDIPLDRCVRIFPHHNNTSGFFVAVLTKLSEFPTHHDDSLMANKTTRAQDTKEKSFARPVVPSTSFEAANSLNGMQAIVSAGLCKGGKRSREDISSIMDPRGSHAHSFELVNPAREDLIQLSSFYGFDLSERCRKTDDMPCEQVIRSDLFDMRRLASPGKYCIEYPSQARGMNEQMVSVALSAEPEASCGECQSVLGPRDTSERFPLQNLVYKKHTESRLYYISAALQKVVLEFKGPPNFQWISLGVRVLERLDSKMRERCHGCQWRLTQTNARTLSGAEVLEGEAKGQVINLGSCRDERSDAFSNLVPGSLAVIVLPPTLIPLEGFFPSAKSAIIFREETDKTNGTLISPIDLHTQSSPGISSTKFPHTNQAFSNGSLKEAVPIACLLTKSGAVLPYIDKEKALGIVHAANLGKGKPLLQAESDTILGSASMARRYDSRTTTFSPEGRLYQVEYALEAINNASSTLGILAKDGVVIAADKAIVSSLLDQETEKEKIYRIDDHVVCAVAGWTADANILIGHARSISQRFLYSFNEPQPVEPLIVRICDTKQSYTQFGGLRPFGVSFLIAGWDQHFGFQLYHTDPAGNYTGWKATAIGQNNQSAQALLRQQWRDDLSLDEALALAAKVLIKTMDTATPSSERLEFATITRDEASKKTIQQMLTNREIDLLLKTAIEEQKQQQKESGGSNSSSNLS